MTLCILNIPFTIICVTQLQGSFRACPTLVKPREAQNMCLLLKRSLREAPWVMGSVSSCCAGVSNRAQYHGVTCFWFCFSIVFSEGREMWECCLLTPSISPFSQSTRLPSSVGEAAAPPGRLCQEERASTRFKGFELGPAVHWNWLVLTGVK